MADHLYLGLNYALQSKRGKPSKLAVVERGTNEMGEAFIKIRPHHEMQSKFIDRKLRQTLDAEISRVIERWKGIPARTDGMYGEMIRNAVDRVLATQFKT